MVNSDDPCPKSFQQTPAKQPHQSVSIRQSYQNQNPPTFSLQSQLQNASLASRATSLLADQNRRTHTAQHQGALSGWPHETYSSSTIKLDHMLRTGKTMVERTWNSLYSGACDTNVPDMSIDDPRGFSNTQGPGFDWQSTLTYQAFRQDGSGFVHDNKNSDYLKLSPQILIPAGDVASAPRICVEPRTIQPPSKGPPRRISAIEKAQQYKQKQQLQNGLLTPPNSSSPQWSPYLPSYQDIPASDPPRFSSIHSQMHQPLARDSSQDLRNSDGISSVFRNSCSRDAPQTLITTPQASQSPRTISQRTTLRRSNVPVSNPLNRCHDLSSQAFGLSPPHPGPPPNSLLPPIPRPDADRSLVPLSPTSPDVRLHNFSQHQPRSIPLARLIQRRRLSSVPEEDFTSFMDQRRSPTPPLVQPISKSLSADRVQALSQDLSPADHRQLYSPANATSDARTPSPVPDTLMPRSKFDTGILLSECQYVNVKLPKKQVEATRYINKDGLKLGIGRIKDRHRYRKGNHTHVSEPSKENMKGDVGGSFEKPRKKGRGKKMSTSGT
jgi:hypothetical protein